MSKLQPVPVGPFIEVPSGNHFSKLPSGIDLNAVWGIVGPSVERNMRALPLWKVIAMAYVEGLQHGAALSQGGGA